MTNAGKRGKTCRVAWWSGFRWTGDPTQTDYVEADHNSLQSEVVIKALTPEMSFDEALAAVRAAVDRFPAPWVLLSEPDEIRGIDAPKEKLTAGKDGVWCGTLDNHGVHLRDLTDPHNEPTMITHRQTNHAAYAMARKVWFRVMQATTMHEASEILRLAGCRLHYYCAMD
jgi:hypothetical protein